MGKGVSWKKPPNCIDSSEYEPCWLVAENLDHNSLAAAFQMFPADADPDEVTQQQEINEEEEDEEEQTDLDDDLSEEEESDGSEDEDDVASYEGDIEDYDNVDDDDGESKVILHATKDPSTSHLEESGESRSKTIA